MLKNSYSEIKSACIMLQSLCIYHFLFPVSDCFIRVDQVNLTAYPLIALLERNVLCYKNFTKILPSDIYFKFLFGFLIIYVEFLKARTSHYDSFQEAHNGSILDCLDDMLGKYVVLKLHCRSPHKSMQHDKYNYQVVPWPSLPHPRPFQVLILHVTSVKHVIKKIITKKCKCADYCTFTCVYTKGITYINKKSQISVDCLIGKNYFTIFIFQTSVDRITETIISLSGLDAALDACVSLGWAFVSLG